MEGIVSGWGQIESSGELSNSLKILNLPTVDFLQCRNASAPSFRKYITNDKFCAGHLTGESVCRGDSGGGLVIPRQINDVQVYYLYGIVSNGPRKEDSCDNTKYAVFTNVYLYLSMIKKCYFDYIANTF